MSREPDWCRTRDDRLAIEAFREGVGTSGVELVHDYLVQDGGAERVLAVVASVLPEAGLTVLVADADRWGRRFHGVPIRTTWAQRLLVGRRFRALLPVYPFAATGLVFPRARLVLSSSSAFVKAARAPLGVHCCYCYSPMRFAHAPSTYLRGQVGRRLVGLALSPAFAGLRRWDRVTSSADRIDTVIAISEAIRERIRATWGRESELVHPPVDVGRARPRSQWAPGGPFLVLARLLAYKRIDLAVQACTRLGRQLVVIGDGPDRARLERLAGPTVQFMGRLSDAEVDGWLGRATALLWPGEEDFGLAPVEAMARGTPVVALAAGGALETVIPGRTGVRFDVPTVDSLEVAIQNLEATHFEVAALREHAERYSIAAFLRNLGAVVRSTLDRRVG